MQRVPIEKKVRIKDNLIYLIKKARIKSTKNKIIYSSDKQFVEVAVLKLLKREGLIK